MPSPTRIGAVSYLNTRTLVYGLKEGLNPGNLELSFDTPSNLADRIESGDLDIALLPSIELARIPGLEVVPGLSITCDGPSRSVLLVSKLPVEEIRTVALDPESRTSNALVQILFATAWNSKPTFLSGCRDLDKALDMADATVRIGDKALFEPLPDGLHTYDLSGVWAERTGLPFVFAVWACRPGAMDQPLYKRLHACRRSGKLAIPAIAREWEWDGARFPDLVETYLTKNIRTRFGSRELQGLKGFLEVAAGCGLIPSAPEIKLAFHRWTECHGKAAGMMATGRHRS
jgi:chorismate dehydratase